MVWVGGLLLALVPTIVLSSNPNVIFIVSDDLGWDDVGFRSHQINTPNIDQLAHEGIVLDQYYVQDVCSPSRSTFLSGMFPLHHSINDWIPPSSSYGLPLNITTLADHMHSAGYSTHAIGKWHCGFYKWDYTPTFRGFDSFYGFYSGGEGYFNHEAGGAFDFRRDPKPKCGEGCSSVAWQDQGQYSTTLFSKEAVSIVKAHNTKQPLFMYLAYQAVHAPMEVPDSYVKPYENKIHDNHRKHFAGMLSCMDEGIGNLTDALKEKGMLDNTLIVFTTDNGGPTPDTPGGDYVGSRNWPLRGGKHSIWEGGTRGTALLHGPMLALKSYEYKNLMHGADWLPTLMAAVGHPVDTKGIDGVNQWDALNTNGSSVRPSFIYGRHDDAPQSNVDDAIRVGKWKLFQGTGGKPNTWTPPVNSSRGGGGSVGNVNLEGEWVVDVDGDGYLLYDLEADPTEHHDVSAANPVTVAALKRQLAAALATGVPTAKNDPKCGKPVQPNNTHVGKVWAPWC